MATRTAPITTQVALTATETDLGALFGETEGKFRLTVPSGATSSVWLGKTGVTATGSDGGGAYVAGTCVQLPSTSMRGWFAITNGASVTITLECATGGADAPDWSDAGTTSPGGGGGGGETVDQGTGDPANPWAVQGVNGGTPERLATHALQGAGLPNALTPGGGVKVGLVDELPAGTQTIGKTDQGAAGSTSWKTIDDNSAAIKTAVERIPAQGQALATGSLPMVLPLTQAAGPLATSAKQPAFGTAGTPSVEVVSVQGVAGGTPVPSSNAAATQADGHSATIGATGDATSANTVIGRLKNFLSRLPAALAANGGLMISTVTQTASNYLVVQDSDGTNLNPTKKVQGPNAIGGAITNPVMLGGQFSGVAIVFAGDSGNRQLVAGAAATGTAVAGNPVLTGGSDGTSARTLELKASNPLAADYGIKTREIPLQKSVVKTTAGTPAASLVVRAGPCWLFDVFVANQTATAGYLTVYDLTSTPTHGAAATARKIVGRHIDTKTGADPFNLFEDFGGLYFATGCVIVIENAEDDANTNTTAAPALVMDAMFVAGT